jgi:hypothetical protein
MKYNTSGNDLSTENDLFFETQGKSYTRRTDSDKSVNATEFVVGTTLRHEIDGDEANLWSPQNKEVGRKIVRVEALSNPM